jgi:regulator of RNase E activity RraB
MALLYTDEDGARVCVYEYDPQENIYEEKNRLLYLFIKFDGEDETLLHLENKLKDEAEVLKLDYVGWRLFDGWLEFYFYAEDAKGVESAFNALLKPQYQCEFGQRKDKKYETYQTLLMPNDFEYHQLQSEDIIAELEEAEEDLSMPREIEFYAMFMTMSQRERFTQAVADKSFTVSNAFIHENAEDDYVYGVVFTRNSSISLVKLNELSKAFLPLIQKEHGRYEGWGTEATA